METYGQSPLLTNTQHIQQQMHPPKNWLLENILITIFCCNILGVIGIWFSAQVESKFYKGDITGAQTDANTAKTLALVTLVLGGLGIAAVIFMYGAVIIAAIGSGGVH